MSKSSLTGTVLLLCASKRFALTIAVGVFTVGLIAGDTGNASAQESADKKTSDAKKPVADAEKRPNPDDAPAVVRYPFSVTTDGDTLYMVDLDLPGVWRITDEGRDLYFRGTKWLRKPMNSPRPVTLHPNGGLLVGDSATREVYHIREGESAEPLCEGWIGIPMAIAVAPDKKSFYVGDAEKYATFQVPIEGGKSKLVARVNARGLAFDDDGNLWATTPNADAVVKIDVKMDMTDKEEGSNVTAVIKDRPYGYPNGLVWAGDHGYVVDVYEKAIWKFTPDGKTEKWVEDKAFVSPNGIGINDEAVFVTDPRAKQLFQFDRKSKKRTDRLEPDAFTKPLAQ